MTKWLEINKMALLRRCCFYQFIICLLLFQYLIIEQEKKKKLGLYISESLKGKERRLFFSCWFLDHTSLRLVFFSLLLTLLLCLATPLDSIIFLQLHSKLALHNLITIFKVNFILIPINPLISTRNPIF